MAIWGWLAFVFVAFAIGSAVGTKTLDNARRRRVRAGRHRRSRRASPESAEEMVLVQSATATVTDPASAPSSRSPSAACGRALRPGLREPLLAGADGQISADGHSALLRFQIAGDGRGAPGPRRAGPRPGRIAQRAHPGSTSMSSATRAPTSRSRNRSPTTSRKAEMTSLPITLLILLIAFGPVLAAGVPLLLALTAVVATIGLLGPISHAFGGVAEHDRRGDPLDRARGRASTTRSSTCDASVRSARPGAASRPPWRPPRRPRAERS